MRYPKPTKLYPNNKTIKKIFRGTMPKGPTDICRHGEVGYRDLERIISRSFLVISRLSKVLVEMEKKFSDAKETVEYITKQMESREEKYIEAIEILKQRLYGTKGNRRRPN